MIPSQDDNIETTKFAWYGTLLMTISKSSKEILLDFLIEFCIKSVIEPRNCEKLLIV